MNIRDILLTISLAMTAVCLYGLYSARERLWLEPELAAERRWAGTNGEVNRLIDKCDSLTEDFKEIRASNNELWKKFKEIEGSATTLARFINSNAITEWEKKFAVLDAQWSGYKLNFEKILNEDGTLKDLENKFVTNEKFWDTTTDMKATLYNLQNKLNNKETVFDKFGQQVEAMKTIFSKLKPE